MIGLFGIYAIDRDRPVDCSTMAACIDRSRYRVEGAMAPGASLGGARHISGLGWSMAEADGIQALVMGEIWDGDALLDGVPGAGALTKPLSPAEIVLALYRADALPRVSDANGLFAAALHDRKAHRLVLLTDRVCGVPLHLHRNAARWAFASQLHCLLAEGNVPRRADPDGIAQLFTLQRTFGATTNLAGVEALPAACIVTITGNSRADHRYAELAWDPAYRDARDAGRDLAEAMRRAVLRQTTAAGAGPGLLLSGGLDSRMVMGAAPHGALPGFTTASFAENPELDLARRTAALCGNGFTPLIVNPERTLDVLDETTLGNNGLYPASTQISVFMPEVARHCDVALTGHGLDYTFRGYYLPARFLRLPGMSATRLPTLRPVPTRPTGADVLSNLRQGPKAEVVRRLVRPEWQDRWWTGQREALHDLLTPWLSSAEPINAWDAFILHSLSKHYAFTGMMAVRQHCVLRLPAYDRDVFDTYLRMTPAQRIGAHATLTALERLSPPLGSLENANTGLPANLGPWKEIWGLMLRAAGRRIGLLERPAKPSNMHSAGSWQDIDMLYRDGPAHRAHFRAIRGRLDALSLGILDTDALASALDDHLEGRAKHGKLLRHLLTHDAWIRVYGIDGHGG